MSDAPELYRPAPKYPAQKPVALLTGASRGIGRALAAELGASGYHVILCARTQGGLEEADDEIRKAGGTSTVAVTDLSDARSIEALTAELARRVGRLDLLVSAAAQRETPSPAAHLEPKYWRKTFAVNADANAHLLRCFDPLLRLAAAAPLGAPGIPARPAALFVTDTHGTAFSGAYGASKAAMESLVRAYAQESASFIDVMLARPKPTLTALKAAVSPGAAPGSLTSAQASAAFLARLIAQRPAPDQHGDIYYVDA